MSSKSEVELEINRFVDELLDCCETVEDIIYCKKLIAAEAQEYTEKVLINKPKSEWNERDHKLMERLKKSTIDLLKDD